MPEALTVKQALTAQHAMSSTVSGMKPAKGMGPHGDAAPIVTGAAPPPRFH